MKPINKTLTVYAITIILCILILIWVLELWKADLGIPFVYAGDTGDTLFSSIFIKGIMENGWYLHNPYLGAPFGLDLYDFPAADNFQFLIMKIISLFSSNFAVVLNLYFLLTFPLIALTAVFVFRSFNISSSIAIVFALLYSFLPYHFLRGESHLLLSAYYIIPLITLLLLWIWDDKPIFFLFDETVNKYKINFLNNKSLLSIFVSLIAGSTGIYYAFFSCFFLFIAGLSSFINKKNIYNLLSALILIAFITGTVFFNLLPSVVYNFQNGANPEIAQRNPVEAEVYGLKITHLLLPMSGHRISLINELRDKYNQLKYPVQGEGSETLGLIGSFGFLALLSVFIFKFNDNNFFPGLYKRLAVLNLSAVLLGTIGGFGSLFAFFIAPNIRCYNRISIFIAFFSLFAGALFLEGYRQKYIRTKRQKYTLYFFLIMLLSIGVFDQTTKNFVPSYATNKEYFLHDEDFIKTIEKSVPANSMIFQLPYVPFPEYPSIYNMEDYQLFRGYLHSHNLRWSYGAMKGRIKSKWNAYVVKKPVDEFLIAISLAGFNGIYIDRNGFADRGAQIEAELTRMLNTSPIVSKKNLLVFFNMANFNAALKKKYNRAELEELKEKALYTTVSSKLKNKSELILKTGNKDELLHVGFKNGIVSYGMSLEPLSLSNNFTIELIVKPFGKQVSSSGILGNHPGKGFEGFVIQQDNDKQNVYTFGFGNGNEWLPGAKFKLNEDVWNYLVIVVEKNNIKVFNNSLLVASVDAKGTIRNSEMPLYIGNWISGDRPFNGQIEEVRISNTNLSEKDIIMNWQEIQPNAHEASPHA